MITNCLTSDPIQPSSLVRYVLPPHHNNYITLVFLSLSLRAAATSPWYARAHGSPLFFFFFDAASIPSSSEFDAIASSSFFVHLSPSYRASAATLADGGGRQRRFGCGGSAHGCNNQAQAGACRRRWRFFFPL